MLFTENLTTVKEVINSLQTIVKEEMNYASDNEALSKLSKNTDGLLAKCNEQVFQVAVIALAKSGKSTFNNALLGTEYLPSSNVPETARIVRIIHNPTYPQGLLSDRETTIEGQKEIRDYLTSINLAARLDNKQPSEDELRLEAPIETLSTENFNGVTFEILDTPGPNEAGADKLKTKVNTLLEKVDVIIYILDYTKLKTNDEALIVADLAKRPNLFTTNRLFFVVNKIDEQDRNGLSPSEVVEYVFEFLQKNIMDSNSNPLFTTKDRIFTVSARKALIARLVQKPNPSEGIVSDYCNSFAELGADFPLDALLKYAPQRLIGSNLPHIEDSILQFIYGNREQILLNSLIEGTTDALLQLENYLFLAKSANEMNVGELKVKIDELRNEVSQVKSSLRQLDAEAEKFKGELNEWVDNSFHSFSEVCQNLIDAAFSLRQNEATGMWARAKSLIKGATQGFLDILGLSDDKRKWVDETLFSLTKRIDSLEGHKDNNSLRSILEQTNNEIMGLLHNFFEDFRHHLENKGKDKQHELLEKFNAIVNDCRAKIEKKLGKTFNITLHPIKVEFEQGDVSDMHTKINNFITTHTHQHGHRVKDGWCSYKTVYSYSHTFTVDRQAIKDEWLKKIKNLFEGSQQTAISFIDKTIIQEAEKAKNNFSNYAQGYIQVIKRENLEKAKGEVEIKKRNLALAELFVKVNELKSMLNI